MSKKNIFLLMSAFFAMNVVAAERTVAVSSAELNVIKAETDVLGRHNSKVRNTPQAYVKGVKKSVNQNFLAKQGSSLPNPNTVSIKKTWGVFEFKADSNGTMIKTYYLNGVKRSESEYVSLVQNIEDNDSARIAFKNFYISSYNKVIKDSSKSVSGVTVEKKTHDCSGQNSCVQFFDVSCSQAVLESCKYYKTTERYEFFDYATVVNNSNLYKYLISGGKKGNNIGISFTENDLPLSNFGIDYVKLGNCSEGYADRINHGTKVARTIKTIVPKATLYGLTTSCTDSIIQVALPIDGYDKNPKIYIGNHSYGQAGDAYDTLKSRFIDDFVYNTRTIEIASAGNEGLFNYKNISENARGVNVISVGAVHNGLTYDRSSSRVNPNYPNSGGKYVKPEIANYADLLFPKADVFEVTKKGKISTNKEILTPFFRQTSSATPYTTATVALLLDKYPFYRWHPEVVKALLITSSIKTITGAENHDKDNESKYAMGVPDGRAMAQYNRSRFWNGNNGDHFVNGKIEFDEKGITAGKRYRIAIAWLSSGTDVARYGRLPQNLNLKVVQDGKTYMSESESNPFELVDFVAKSSKPLKITIERNIYNNANLGGRVLLGYNLLEVH